MASNATGNTETQVSTLVAESMNDPSITLLPDGGWIAVWGASSEESGNEFIHTLFQRFDATGNPVGAETQVGDPEVFYLDATVLPLSDGGWLVIHDGGDIVQQRFDAAGNAVGGETQINTVSGGLRGLAATALEDGGWVVGWHRNGFNEQVFQQVFDSEGNAVGGEVRVNTTTSGRHFLNDIGALPDGGWVVVWEQGGAINDVLQQRFDANGDPVDGETRVNTIGGGPNSDPTVTALLDGGWVVTWADPDGNQSGIFQQRYDSNGDAVGSQTAVNTTTANSQSDPGVSALPDGGWVVVWHSGGGQDGEFSGIYMQRFDANGDPVGTETLVNLTTAGDQREASVAALDGVGWVVTWTSRDPVTFDEVVMQRVFAADIEGTSGADVIEGTVFGEAIFGLDGDDTINGGNGDDTIEGGEGTDNMDGGDGIDTLSYAGSAQGVAVRLSTGTASGGDAAGDTFVNFENLTGSAQNDTLAGNTGANVLSGGAGNDTLIGLGGADLLIGGEGDDSFDIFPTDDFAGATFDGGAGSDRLLLRTAGEGGHVYDLTEATLTSIEEIEFVADGGGLVDNTKTVSLFASQVGGAGLSSTLLIDGNDSGNRTDLIAISMGDATSLDLSGWTFLQWGTVANFGDGEVITITGDDDAETIIGSSERDVIEGSAGADTLDGGGGNDTASYVGSAAAVVVNLDAGTGSGGDADGDTLISIENLVGSANADTLTGDDGDNIIEGGDGADTMDGGDGNDTLSYAGSSAEVNVNLLTGAASGGDADGDTISNFENLIGSAHDDILTGHDGDSIIDGGAGDDRLVKSSGTTADGRDSWIGGEGTDTFVFAGPQNADHVVDLSLGMLTFAGDLRSTLTGIENVEVLGSAGIVGDGQDNILTAIGDFDNVISGGGGNDIITGGGGADTIDGGDGTDTLNYENSDAAIRIPLSNGNPLSGGHADGDRISNIEIIIGSAFGDDMESAGATELRGGGGNDTLVARGNVDLYGGDDNDLLSVHANDSGRLADATFDGGEGIDTLNIFTDGIEDFTDNTVVNFETLEFRNLQGDSAFTFTAEQIDQFQTIEMRKNGGSGELAVRVLMGDQTSLDLSGRVRFGTPDDRFEILGDGDDETIIGSRIDDVINGGGGNDNLFGGLGADTLDGGAGIDFARYDEADYGDMTVSLQVPVINTGAAAGDTFTGIEGLILGSGNDFIYGDGGDNDLRGGGGHDNIFGSIGADHHHGGDGFDYARYDDAAYGDIVVSLVAPSIGTNVAAGDTFEEIEGLILGGGNDWIFGDTGDNYLYGNAGNDNLFGSLGADHLDGGAGFDYARFDDAGYDGLVADLVGANTNTGAAAGDTYVNIEGLILTGNNDFGFGTDSANYLYGLGGNDFLDGRAGDDYLSGGTGNDTLVGGAGNDIYEFGAGYGRDTVTDFAGGTGLGDRLALQGSFETFADVLAASTQIGANLEIALNGSDVLVLENFSISNFAQDDVII